MKLKTLLLPALLAIAAIAPAQDPTPQPWSIAAVWDFRTKTSSAVILRSIGKIEQPLGFKFDLDLDAFAGSDIDSNVTGGIAISKTFPAARNVDFKFGLAISATQNKPVGAGLLLGLTYRF